MKGLDNYLTTEPDNGYQKWEDSVMKIVSERLPVEYEIDDDKAIQELLRLSVVGSRGFPSSSFSADVIIRHCKLLTKGDK